MSKPDKMTMFRVREHAYREVWGVIQGHIDGDSYFGLTEEDRENGNLDAVVCELQKIANKYANMALRLEESRAEKKARPA